jgi:hypothetical protein
MSTFVVKTKKHFKVILTTPLGWLSFFLSNLFWSSFWLLPLIYGFLFQNNDYIVLAGAIYLFFLQPLIPMWLITPLTTFFIYKLIKPKNKTDVI